MRSLTNAKTSTAICANGGSSRDAPRKRMNIWHAFQATNFTERTAKCDPKMDDVIATRPTSRPSRNGSSSQRLKTLRTRSRASFKDELKAKSGPLAGTRPTPLLGAGAFALPTDVKAIIKSGSKGPKRNAATRFGLPEVSGSRFY